MQPFMMDAVTSHLENFGPCQGTTWADGKTHFWPEDCPFRVCTDVLQKQAESLNFSDNLDFGFDVATRIAPLANAYSDPKSSHELASPPPMVNAKFATAFSMLNSVRHMQQFGAAALKTYISTETTRCPILVNGQYRQALAFDLAVQRAAKFDESATQVVMRLALEAKGSGSVDGDARDTNVAQVIMPLIENFEDVLASSKLLLSALKCCMQNKLRQHMESMATKTRQLWLPDFRTFFGVGNIADRNEVKIMRAFASTKPKLVRVACVDLLKLAGEMETLNGNFLSLSEAISSLHLVCHDGELYCGYVGIFVNLIIKPKQGWPKPKIEQDVITGIRGLQDRGLWIRDDEKEVISKDYSSNSSISCNTSHGSYSSYNSNSISFNFCLYSR